MDVLDLFLEYFFRKGLGMPLDLVACITEYLDSGVAHSCSVEPFCATPVQDSLSLPSRSNTLMSPVLNGFSALLAGDPFFPGDPDVVILHSC